MNIIFINDSRDDNAKTRQEIRYANLFPNSHISFIGVNSGLGPVSTIEASGNLIDSLDTLGDNEGLICVNVAPRGQIKEDGGNGSNFCYFWYKKVLVVSTIKSYNLSLVKKLKLIKNIHTLDMEEVLDFTYKLQLITDKQRKYISKTQFRSFDFQPRVSRWIWDKYKVPSTTTSIDKIADPPKSVWLIDSFGNAKTTIIKNDLPTLKDDPLKVNTNLGPFRYYKRLKDVPFGETALYTGSSGIGDKRFIELATQGVAGSIAKKLNLKVGQKIELM